MNRIPQDLCLEGIIGSFTTQLRIGQFDLQLTFGEIDFQIESEIELFRNGECIGLWYEGRFPSPEFYEIMNSDVVKYTIPDDKLLVLHLENNIEIHMKDNSDQFESMKITWGQKQWII